MLVSWHAMKTLETATLPRVKSCKVGYMLSFLYLFKNSMWILVEMPHPVFVQ